MELIKQKSKKEKINTFEAFDNRLAIHYSFEQIIEGYFKILDRTRNAHFEEIQEKKIDFLLQVMEIFDITEERKKAYIDNIINQYLKEEYYFEAIEAINKINVEMPEMEKYLNIKVSEIHLAEGKI